MGNLLKDQVLGRECFRHRKVFCVRTKELLELPRKLNFVIIVQQRTILSCSLFKEERKKLTRLSKGASFQHSLLAMKL